MRKIIFTIIFITVIAIIGFISLWKNGHQSSSSNINTNANRKETVPAENLTTSSTGFTTQTFSSAFVPLSFVYPKKWGEAQENLSPASAERGEKGQYYYLTFSKNADISGGGRSSNFTAARGATLFDFKGFNGKTTSELCDSLSADVCDSINENVVRLIRVPKYSTNCPSNPAQYTPAVLFAVNLPTNATVGGVMIEFQLSQKNIDCEDIATSEYDKQMNNLLNSLRGGYSSDAYLQDFITNVNIFGDSLVIKSF